MNKSRHVVVVSVFLVGSEMRFFKLNFVKSLESVLLLSVCIMSCFKSPSINMSSVLISY